MEIYVKQGVPLTYEQALKHVLSLVHAMKMALLEKAAAGDLAPQELLCCLENRMGYTNALLHLAEGLAEECEIDFEPCEGCSAEATHTDSEGVPLCRVCYDALIAEDQ